MIDAASALTAIGRLEDNEIDLADAALMLALSATPDDAEKIPHARAHLSALARDASVLGDAERGAADPATRAGALAGLLVGRHGYQGDRATYEDPANANMLRVVARRRGLPVSLGIIWLHAARAAGWPAHGVDFPGHFLIALGGGGRHALVDAFDSGAVLGDAELHALARRIGAEEALRPQNLTAMPNRAVLLRLQNNIRLRQLRAEDFSAALACAEDMLRIAPDEPGLWREAALIHQKLDHVAAAIRCWDRFVALSPEGEAAAHARRMAERLRARLN